jgi:hypothetical protein
LGQNRINEENVAACDNDIINIDKEIKDIIIVLKNEEGRVSLRLSELLALKKGFEFMKSCSWCLFKPIKRFVNETNMIWVLIIHKP